MRAQFGGLVDLRVCCWSDGSRCRSLDCCCWSRLPSSFTPWRQAAP